MTKLIRLVLLTSSLFIFCAQAEEKPLVVFFGGYASTSQQMAAWKAAVQRSMPAYEIEAIPYPAGATAGRDSAVSHAQTTLARLAKIINSKPGRRVVIAGHSSGSALSNALARKVTNPKNVKLVALDGFSPDQGLQKRFETECWSAANGDAQSRNFGSSKSNCGRNFRTAKMRGGGCKSAWCLHFAMLNKNASFDGNWRQGGYANLEPNIDWIGPSGPATTTALTSGGKPQRASSGFLDDDDATAGK